MQSKRESNIVIQNKTGQQAETHRQKNILKQKTNKTKTKSKTQKLKLETEIEWHETKNTRIAGKTVSFIRNRKKQA